MKVEDLIVYGKKFLHSNEVNILLASVLGYDTLELLTHLDEKVSTENVDKFKKMIEVRLNNYPLQYIVGNVNFYGYEFDVKENVLIPRFETEQLVYYVSEFIKKNFNDDIKLIDLGCGSGVIGIVLSKILDNVSVTSLDISNYALELTRSNALKLDADIEIIKGDMLSEITSKFDVIVSNPPYISFDEQIEDIVKNNEPHLALYADENGIEFYRKILSNVSKNLNSKFLIAFEIGYTQANKVIELSNTYLKNIKIEVHKDLSGKDRVVLIYSNNF